MKSWPKVIICYNLVLSILIWPQKYHFCPYLGLLNCIYHYWTIFWRYLGLISLIWAYLPFNCPDFTICAICTLYIYSSIEIAPLCKILEQSDHYSWRYCISKNWGLQKCRHECSLGVNPVIDNSDVASDNSPLYQIWKQSDYYLWRYCILKIWGIQVSFGC